MNLLWIFLIALGVFAFMTFVRKWHDYSMLIMIAIGCAVSAGFYNGYWYPLSMKGNVIIFGVSSVLVCAFIFTVLFCAHNHSIQRAKVLTSSTIAAILISAVIEFVTKVVSKGWNVEILKVCASYVFSAIALFVLVWTILYIYDGMKEKKFNVYAMFTLLAFIGVIIYTAIYGGLCLTIYYDKMIDLFAPVLYGHLIISVICVGLGLLSYFVNSHFWIPKHFEKEEK